MRKNGNHKQVNIKISCILLMFCLLPNLSKAQINPAAIFTDQMILQREISIPVWGKATPGETIQVTIENIFVSGTADTLGNWLVSLPSFPAGGPFDLKITGEKDTLIYKDVLIGDVWFASGQSNMEHPMQGWKWIPESEITNFKN